MISHIRNTLVYAGYALAAIIFLMLAIYAITLASGYKIDWQNRTLAKTGLIAVATVPSGAKVALNNKNIGGATPLSMKYLLPGAYNLRVSKDGYMPYGGVINVQASLVSDQRDVTLFLNNPAMEQVAMTFAPKHLIPFSGNKMLLQDSSGNLFIYDTGKSDVTPLFTNWPKNSGQVSQLILTKAAVSDSGRTAVVTLQQGKSSRFLLWQENQNPVWLDKNAPKYSSDLYLDNDTNLLTFNDSSVWLEDLKTLTPQIILKNVLGAAFLNGHFYVVRAAAAATATARQSSSASGSASLLSEISSKGEIVRDYNADLPAATYFHLWQFGNFFLINAQTSATSTLWLYDSRSNGALTRLAGDFSGPVFEIGKDFVYQDGKSLMAYNHETNTDPVSIVTMLTPIQFLSIYHRVLFFMQGASLRTVDYSGAGSNILLNLNQPNIFIDPNAQYLYALNDAGMGRWKIR
jgi:hypothetical protein